MYRPSELHKLLNEWGTQPRKSLSQNFLIDGNIIRKIVNAADVRSEDVILEIGPGPGALTQALLETGAQVVAVEKDPVLAERLRRLQGNLTVYTDDILEFDFSKYLDPLLNKKKAKVIANLPYHITTPIVSQLIRMHRRFQSFTIMVQHEMALRMTSGPGNKDYGSLTLFLNFHSDVEYAFKVKRTCFYPEPNVDSALVRIHLKQPPDISDPDEFQSFVRKAFEQRRKMLKKSLSDEFDAEEVVRALEELNLSPLSRPEELSLEDFVRLFRTVQPPGSEDKKKR